jgi:hypothetical protein
MQCTTGNIARNCDQKHKIGKMTGHRGEFKRLINLEIGSEQQQKNPDCGRQSSVVFIWKRTNQLPYSLNCIDEFQNPTSEVRQSQAATP